MCALNHALCPYVTGMGSNVAIIQTRTSEPLFVVSCSILVSTRLKKAGRKQQQGGSAVTLSQRSRAESQSEKKVELQWGKKIKS